MNFKLRPLSVESSIGAIVVSTFWIWLALDEIAILRDRGHVVSWIKYVQLIFWIGSFAFSIWSGIKSGQINRRERIERELAARVQLREKGLESGNKG
jgi:hypothetical protein